VSKLSELLPAGASGKTIEAVATANIASKAPVILNSAGTVSPIVLSGAGLGTPVQFETGAIDSGAVSTVYDPDEQKTVIAYSDSGNSSYGTAVVGTVTSDTTLSFGTPVVFESAGTESISATYDTAANKVVIVYADNGNSSYGTGIVGTVSGTTISFGTAVVFSSNDSRANCCIFEPNSGTVVVASKQFSGLNRGDTHVGTVSGTSISFGSSDTFLSTIPEYISMSYDPDNSNQILIVCRNDSNGYCTAVLAARSGGGMSFGTPVVILANSTYWTQTVYDTVQNKHVVFWSNQGSNYDGNVIVGTTSGTNVSFGSAVVWQAGSAGNGVQYTGACWDSVNNRIPMAYTLKAASDAASVGYVLSATLDSGGTVTFSAQTQFGTNLSKLNGKCGNFAAFDTDQESMVYGYQSDQNSSTGYALAWQPSSSNLTASNFVGIADAAISSSATGTIVVQGGTATGVSLDSYFSLGTPVVYETATTYYTASTYDSTNDKTVICYRDNGNSGAGTAIVGTVSGTTISYGTAVVFNSGSTNQMSATFDTNSGKIVIVYEDAAASQRGTAVVGTVSGTSISFGTPVVFRASETGGPPVVTYDSTAQKVVVVYNVDSTTNKGHAIVGTVSGTSISFGTEVIFKNDIYNSQFGVAYDANANRTVITYQKNGGNGTAIVGTVSGTSISFGTEVVYNSADSNGNNAVYDPDSQKVVIVFDTVGVGKGVVGTVSGTGISFGALATFAASGVANGLTNSNPIAYDTTQDKVVLVYEDTTANTLYANTGTVSGTSISFGTATTLTTNNTGYAVVSYDPDVQRSVFAYADGGSSDHGTAIVGTLSTDLATGSKYYVTSTGSYSTSAGSPSVNAGLAISTTALLLNGDT